MDKYLVYFKVVKTIDSCENLNQLSNSKKLVKNYNNMFKDKTIKIGLNKVLNEKLQQLWCS